MFELLETLSSSSRPWRPTSSASPAGRCSKTLIAGKRDPQVLADLAFGKPGQDLVRQLTALEVTLSPAA